MPYYVQIYKSTDLNSPPLSGQAGSAIVLLNACLVDGYSGSVSITTLTRSSSTATATVSAADGLKLKTGQILTVSGANETEYNGTFTITVASTTTFTYTVTGTPATPATGTITASLKLPITSITRGGAGNLTATLTMTNNNTSLVTGNWLTIEGCTSTGAAQYNGTFQITRINDSSFSYQMASDPGANATVTGATYYKAGLQWTRPFSAGTNSQTYKSQATVGANSETYIPRYLQIIDNAATAGTGKEAQAYGAEVMTGDQAGILGQFPTTTQATSGVCFRKSTTASSVVREWTLWGDEKTFTVSSATGDTTAYHGVSFGYFISTKSNDEYNTFVGGNSAFNTGSSDFVPIFAIGLFCNTVLTSGGLYICRGYSQMGTSVVGALSGAASTTSLSGGGPVFSGTNSTWLSGFNGSDSGLYACPIFLHDTVGVLRGRLPGTYTCLNGVILNNYDTVTNIVGLSGTTFMSIYVGHGSTTGMALVDAFGPWI